MTIQSQKFWHFLAAWQQTITGAVSKPRPQSCNSSAESAIFYLEKTGEFGERSNAETKLALF
jgi:hypothetical protein